MSARASWAVGSDTQRLVGLEDARLAMGALWTPDSSGIDTLAGFRPVPAGAASPGLVTATGTPDVSVHVAAFQAVLPSTRGVGPYVLTLDAPADLDVLTAHPADPSNPRHDLVVAQQSDMLYGDASSVMTVRVVTGVASAAPADPAVDGSPDYVLLGRVRVAAGATSIMPADIDDLRPSPLCTVAVGGVLPVGSQAIRDALHPWAGQVIARTDRDWMECFDGTEWRVRGVAVVATTADLSAVTAPVTGQMAVVTDTGALMRWTGSAWTDQPSGPPWTDYSDILNFSANSGGPTQGSSSYSARWIWVGQHVIRVAIRIVIGAGFSPGSGIYSFSLPMPSPDNGGYGAVGSWLVLDAGNAVRAGSVFQYSPAGIQLWRNGDGSPIGSGTQSWSAGDEIRISHTYEV